MTPILLEKADFMKVVTVTVMLLTFIFVAGFIYGYSKAEHLQQLPMASINIDVPPVAVASESVDRDQIVPETVPQGHDRDVDVADVGDLEAAHQHVHTVDKVAVETTTELPEIEAEKVSNMAEVVSAPTSLGVGGPRQARQTDPVELMMDTADEASARYTVQVGIFGSSGNAERKLESLRSMRLNAYATEFNDAKDRARFNVRFGYFDRKTEALAALVSYRDVFSSDGFLVRIKR